VVFEFVRVSQQINSQRLKLDRDRMVRLLASDLDERISMRSDMREKLDLHVLNIPAYQPGMAGVSSIKEKAAILRGACVYDSLRPDPADTEGCYFGSSSVDFFSA
jgi:hypothetical protein